MKNLTFKILAALLEKAHTRTGLMALEKALVWGIPFNIPHGFKLLKLDAQEAIMKLPFKRANKNHLGTAHACAIATLGEFPAGALLIKHFSPENYRVVMTELNVKYEKPGVGDLIGRAQVEARDLASSEQELSKNGQTFITASTIVTNAKDETVATVTTYWQLKEWGRTKHRQSLSLK